MAKSTQKSAEAAAASGDAGQQRPIGAGFRQGIITAITVFALFRALRPEDDVEIEYRKTVKWFVASAIVLVIALLFAVAEFDVGFGSK